MPLFEVIVNSIINSTSASNNSSLIKVEIEREKSQGLFESGLIVDKEGNVIPPPITSITVLDNGAGFDDENFESFNTAYSETHKDRGCKGVGRFTMLACFSKVLVKSIYKRNSKKWTREFSFDINKEVYPIDGNPIELDELASNETRVTLQDYYPVFKNKSAVSTNEIAAAIIDHCLPFLLSKKPPTIILKDEISDEEIILNDILRNVISFDGPDEKFDPLNNGTKFKVQIIKRKDGRMNRLRLCAHNRVVGKTKNLSSLLTELEAPLDNENGEKYYIDVYVSSSFFDSKVNSVRNSFNIVEDGDENLLFPEISMKDIETGLVNLLKKKYEKIFRRLEDETLKRVRSYILDPKKMRVRYRSLLSRPDLLKKIPYNTTGDKIEEYLFKIKMTLEKELNVNLKKALKRSQPEDFEEYSKIVKTYLDQEAKFAKDKLADLVIHRKGVLDLLKRLLTLSKGGKYSLEEDLHNLIFPMGENDKTLPFDYHNLWLLDERLAFHSYVSSDQTLKTNPHVNLRSNKEADLLIFDFPWAFSEVEKELSSMVVFEFKRPGREFNNEQEKKLDSLVMKYFEDLMAPKKRSISGELLNLENTTPKFGYIICDIDKDMIEYNTLFNDFRKTPKWNAL